MNTESLMLHFMTLATVQGAYTFAPAAGDPGLLEHRIARLERQIDAL